MANFNELERGSLMDLLSSLSGGLSGDTGWAVLQSILGGQQQRVDQRQARLSSLSDMLVGSAAQGGTYAGAQSLADAYTPGDNKLPPRIQNTLAGLYPDTPGTPGTPAYRPMGADPGSPAIPGTPAGPPQGMSQSPTYNVPYSPQDQLAQVELEKQMAAAETAPLVAQVLAEQDVRGLVQAGIPIDQVMGAALSSETYATMDPGTQASYVMALQTAIENARIELDKAFAAENAPLQGATPGSLQYAGRGGVGYAGQQPMMPGTYAR